MADDQSHEPEFTDHEPQPAGELGPELAAEVAQMHKDIADTEALNEELNEDRTTLAREIGFPLEQDIPGTEAFAPQGEDALEPCERLERLLQRLAQAGGR